MHPCKPSISMCIRSRSTEIVHVLSCRTYLRATTATGDLSEAGSLAAEGDASFWERLQCTRSRVWVFTSNAQSSWGALYFSWLVLAAIVVSSFAFVLETLPKLRGHKVRRCPCRTFGRLHCESGGNIMSGTCCVHGWLYWQFC